MISDERKAQIVSAYSLLLVMKNLDDVAAMDTKKVARMSVQFYSNLGALLNVVHIENSNTGFAKLQAQMLELLESYHKELVDFVDSVTK